jgi:zinc/manganese transport system substrate-binding protein
MTHTLRTVLAALTLTLLGPAAHAADATSAPLKVVASFSILADMVSQVAGDAAEVTSLVGPNGDAHVYEPTPADARRLSQADLVVINGLRFEGWMERLARSAGTRRPVVVATKGITPRQLDGAADPHAWQSLPNARAYVENIRAALVGARPAQTEALNARAAAYLQKIDALQARAVALFADVPPQQRRVITTHDAFGYLGQAFGVQFIAPQKWSTEAEPSARDVAGVIRQIKALKVRALFVENMSDRRMMERIAQETGAIVGGSLYADALSGARSRGGNFPWRSRRRAVGARLAGRQLPWNV